MEIKQKPFYVVIPARYASTRLPGKPLRLIAGKAMILHVCERAMQSDASRVIVATDDERIFKLVSEAGQEVVMTRADHQSGTDRLAEVAESLYWGDSEVVVNLQGDEPLISPDMINKVAGLLHEEVNASVSTLASPIVTASEIFDPNVVKVVADRFGFALYFSRAPIPWDRENFPDSTIRPFRYLRHIGIYGYTAGFLKRYLQWSSSLLESTERLEQLRILWNGERIRVAEVSEMPEAGVDTEQDIKRVEALIKEGFLTR